MSLGTNISRLRAEKHLSQGDLAKLLDVSRQSVSKWETDGSVPDLDKLVKLSRVFDVTLDELVTGEAPPHPGDSAAPEAAVQAPGPAGLPSRKIAGIILFCMAFLTLLVCTAAGGVLTGLILCVPFLLCGAICFLAKKRPGLWCAWTVYLLVELYLRWGTGITWQLTMLTFSFTPEMNYTRLLVSWGQLIVMLVMFAVTIHSFRHVRLEPCRRNFILLGIGWAAIVGLNALKSWGYTQLYQSPSLSFGQGTYLLMQAGDLLLLAGFAALLVATACAFRPWRRRRKGTF